MFKRGKGAGVDVDVTLDVEMGPVVSSLGLMLRLELLDDVLAWPGDVAGGVRSTIDLISTIAVVSGKRASVYWFERSLYVVQKAVDDCSSRRRVVISLVLSRRPVPDSFRECNRVVKWREFDGGQE